jgi:hypothetical protein
MEATVRKGPATAGINLQLVASNFFPQDYLHTTERYTTAGASLRKIYLE